MGRWEHTHESLQRAAFELFAERGYAATSTAQIAGRAGVSEMTLFRHFPSKEALLLADPFDPVMADAVRARPAMEPPMRALVEGIRESWARVDEESQRALRATLRIVTETPALRGAVERNSAATVEALARAVVERGASEARARIAASAVIAGLSTALLAWAQAPDAALEASVHTALDVLGGA